MSTSSTTYKQNEDRACLRQDWLFYYFFKCIHIYKTTHNNAKYYEYLINNIWQYTVPKFYNLSNSETARENMMI